LAGVLKNGGFANANANANANASASQHPVNSYPAQAGWIDTARAT
jgi:hypothetical protein